MSELGPVSQAILDYVNGSIDYIIFYRLIYYVSQKTGASHTEIWYLRRLMALALEGRIDAKVYRTGDKVAIRFRRLQEEEK